MGYKRKTHMSRKNIKVPEPLFNALRDDKDDNQSWPHYLETECLHDTSTGDVDVDAIADAVAVRNMTLDADERTKIAREVAGELR